MAGKAEKGSLDVLIGMGPPKSNEGVEDDVGEIGGNAFIKAIGSKNARDVKDAFRMLYDECRAEHESKESEELEE